jgi:hypothetical protein
MSTQEPTTSQPTVAWTPFLRSLPAGVRAVLFTNAEDHIDRDHSINALKRLMAENERMLSNNRQFRRNHGHEVSYSDKLEFEDAADEYEEIIAGCRTALAILTPAASPEGVVDP